MARKRLLFTLLLALTIFSSLSFASAQTVTTSPTSITAKQEATFTFTVNGFINQSTPGTYVWSWGDLTTNTTTTANSATHTYSREGTYTLNILATIPLDFGADWDVSNDWQTTLTPYSTTITVTATRTELIGANIITGLAVFGVLPIAVGAAVLFLVLKDFGRGQSDVDVVPAVATAIVSIIVTEIAVYVIIAVVNALTI